MPRVATKRAPKAKVTKPETVEGLPAAFELPESFQIRIKDFLRQATKLTEDIKLEFLQHAGQFGCAFRVKNDLEGAHKMVARTGIEPVFQP